MKKTIYSRKSWKDCGVSPEIQEILFSKGFKKPSKIQSASLTFFMKKEEGDLLAQSKNGSGKTLSFLIPAIEFAQKQRLADMEQSEPNICSPYVIILGDSKELCMQIQNVCDLIKYPGLETDFQAKEIEEINRRSNLTAMTAGRLDYMVKRKMMSLDRLRLFIVDECDKILDNDRFGGSMARMMRQVPHSCRIALFSATINEKTKHQAKVFQRTFTEIKFKNKEQIVLKNLTHYYVRCERRQKLDFVDNFLNQFMKTMSSGSVIIFVNTRAFAEDFARRLNDKGHKSDILLGDMDIVTRREVLDEFKQGKIRILLSTNLISRGIDNRKVGLVINLDVPVIWNRDRGAPKELDKDTYFHRVGRTGRFGDYGLALNVVDHPEVMSEIEKIGMSYEIKMIEITMENFSQIIQENEKNLQFNQQKREAMDEDNL